MYHSLWTSDVNSYNDSGSVLFYESVLIQEIEPTTSPIFWANNNSGVCVYDGIYN